MAYDMDQNCPLGEVQPAFDEGESLFFSYFECYIRMIGQGSTYRMKASHSYEGGSGLFWVYRRLFTRNYHWECFFTLLDNSGTTINPWGLGNQVACSAKPQTVHGTRHSACFQCVHEYFRCNLAAPSLGKPMSRNRTLARMRALTLGKVKDCEKGAMLESTRCQLCDLVWQR